MRESARRLMVAAQIAADGAELASPGRTGVAYAPGRCTLVGEHVDYAGGRVACVAIDRGIAASVRPSLDGAWRLVGQAGSVVVRASPEPAGDAADRFFAVALALRDVGIAVPPLDIGVAADLPSGAGLASSAALACAVTLAICDLTGHVLTARELAEVALRSERDIVGVPVGPLDQRAIIDAPPDGALLLDCADGTSEAVRWRWRSVALVVCNTGVRHDVGGEGYRSRRREVAEGLRLLAVESCQEADLAQLEAAGLPDVLHRRMRHVLTETARTDAAAAAMRDADLAGLGALMTASHASLRDDFEVSTPELDGAVEAALATPGCAGARLVGAGFGGSAVALIRRSGAERCARAMTAVAGARSEAWVLQPSGGIASEFDGLLDAG